MRAEFVAVDHKAQGQAPARFLSERMPLHKKTPVFIEMPSVNDHVIKSLGTCTSSVTALPDDIIQGVINSTGARLLVLLGRLPRMITVPVLDWAPGGLTMRFTAVYCSTIWHMVSTFHLNDPQLVRLHSLFALYCPAILLFDPKKS